MWDNECGVKVPKEMIFTASWLQLHSRPIYSFPNPQYIKSLREKVAATPEDPDLKKKLYQALAGQPQFLSPD